MKTPNTILITGATGGIGSALVAVYAQPGRTLILQGRDEHRLAVLARQCESAGAIVRTYSLDLADCDVVLAWMGQLLAQESIDLAILNAGVTSNIGKEGAGESWEDIKRVIDVNLYAVIACVSVLVPHMQQRRSGQIALVSSLAAYYGMPITPAYCASKAALKTYGEALRGWLAPQGIAVNVVLPGFVITSMSDRFPAAKPFSLSPAQAAKLIQRGLTHNRARISFPFPLNLGMWILALLPPVISDRIMRVCGYGYNGPI